MRRRAGVGAVQDRKAAQEKFRDKGTELQENMVAQLTEQLTDFKSKLEAFAVKHRKAIKKDPEFREHFQEMCATIGVDPLASSKGFWSELLGMGSFYYEIAIQAVEIVLSTAHINGGVMTLGELQRRLSASRARNASAKKTDVSCDDILRAFKSLEVLGKSCGVILAGEVEESLVFCVPEELSLDNTTVVQTAVANGTPYVTVNDLVQSLGWTPSRVESVLEHLIRDGIVWLDEFQGNRLYWFPTLFLTARDDTKSIASDTSEAAGETSDKKDSSEL